MTLRTRADAPPRPSPSQLADRRAADEAVPGRTREPSMASRYPADWPIDDLGLSARTRNSLRRSDVTSVWQLLTHSRGDLLAIRGFGLKCYRDVSAVLRANRLPPPRVRPKEETRSSRAEADRALSELLETRRLLRSMARAVAAWHGPHVQVAVRTAPFAAACARSSPRLRSSWRASPTGPPASHGCSSDATQRPPVLNEAQMSDPKLPLGRVRHSTQSLLPCSAPAGGVLCPAAVAASGNEIVAGYERTEGGSQATGGDRRSGFDLRRAQWRGVLVELRDLGPSRARRTAVRLSRAAKYHALARAASKCKHAPRASMWRVLEAA